MKRMISSITMVFILSAFVVLLTEGVQQTVSSADARESTQRAYQAPSSSASECPYMQSKPACPYLEKKQQSTQTASDREDAIEKAMRSV